MVKEVNKLTLEHNILGLKYVIKQDLLSTFLMVKFQGNDGCTVPTSA